MNISRRAVLISGMWRATRPQGWMKQSLWWMDLGF